MRAIVFLPLVLVTAGCATRAHLRADSHFAPLSPTEFMYVVRADVHSPADSPRYEEMRRSLMAEQVAERRFCPNGFDVTERNATPQAGGAHTIYYRGRCRA